jgi:uncharacterized membrane protein YccF (DUF307 family)
MVFLITNEESKRLSCLGNLIWIVCGGLISFLLYMLGGLVLCLTIIGIPFGKQAFKIGFATLAPFGKIPVEKDNANSLLRLVFNGLWIITFGFSIAMNHLFWAGVLALTIVGLPFAYQHLKLCVISLFPFGREFR